MKKRVLIIGGSGFLGTCLAERIRDEYEVYSGAYTKLLGGGGVSAVRIDITDRRQTFEVVRDIAPDIVVHSASYRFDREFGAQPAEFLELNVLGSLNVGRACLEAGTKVLIAISSSRAANPAQSPYGMTKSLMERAYCSIGSTGSLTALCLRLPHIVWSTGTVFNLWRDMHDAGKVIYSNGADEYRFMTSAQAAVRAIQQCMHQAPHWRGKVVVPPAKAAQLRTVLDLWVRERGGRWESTASRSVPQDNDMMISAQEAALAETFMIDGEDFRVFDPNENVASQPQRDEDRPRAEVDYFNEEEIVALLKS